MLRFYALLTILMLVLSSPGNSHQHDSTDWLNQVIPSTEIYFSESGEYLLLGNASWEVAFRKTNGGLVYITDKSIGGEITIGSRGE